MLGTVCLPAHISLGTPPPRTITVNHAALCAHTSGGSSCFADDMMPDCVANVRKSQSDQSWLEASHRPCHWSSLLGQPVSVNYCWGQLVIASSAQCTLKCNNITL